MPHLLFIGHTPHKIASSINQPYTHKTWHVLAQIIQQYLLEHPDAIPVTSLNLGWEQIAAEISQRLSREFICHSIPKCHKAPTGWYSADKSVYTNALTEAARIQIEPWPLEQTDRVLALWDTKPNTIGKKLYKYQHAGIPITNAWNKFITELTKCQ